METTTNDKPPGLTPSEWRKTMGRFSADVELANFGDLELARRGKSAAGDVRRCTLRGVIDPGATMLVLPEAVVKQLGLEVKGKVKVRYADGRRAMRKEAKAVHLRLNGRESVFDAIVEPKRETALIGAFVLEVFDFLVDCKKQRLVPRDPDYIVSEME